MRDWAALPRDILLEVFGRLQHADILRGTGLACSPWWRAAVEEPTLWRAIDVFLNKGDPTNKRAWEARLAMGRAAVDQSVGTCESFAASLTPTSLPTSPPGTIVSACRFSSDLHRKLQIHIVLRSDLSIGIYSI
ncbi:hypothetical protein BAE44_0002233 [Dichanthelium oligosanthes]|uniref:F-box domain-containing protein n=1 Tax=Dichanthelium oligosanthes TaxID=888268 RepID=A0A1E5WH74_9POAL|nr:hypothetical protein BAE44_0002233 [Dichanthelium oligosanthes]